MAPPVKPYSFATRDVTKELCDHQPPVIHETHGAKEVTPEKVLKRKSKKKRMEYRELTLKDGSVFRGMIMSGSIPKKKKEISGTGELKYAQDGTTYKGALVKGSPHGFGEKFWPSSYGKVYKGYWHKGMMHGRGELVLCEGEVYLGEFKNGFPNGRGIRKWKNGDLYEGDYVNGF